MGNRISITTSVARMALAVILAGAALCMTASESWAEEPAPRCHATARAVPVIFDTDMDTDCDDAGALGMLHALADRGEATILATGVSSGHKWSAACTEAINTYYGRAYVPLGVPARGIVKPSRYAESIATTFPQSIGPVEPRTTSAPIAARVYRDVLERAEDATVVLITVGYLTNVAELLALPAEEGHASGHDLIRQKIKTWVCMGGNFVGDPVHDDLSLSNNNFTFDAMSAYQAITTWPGAIVFVGREIGSVPSGLKAGAALARLPDGHPVRQAYARYFDGTPRDRHIADQTTVLYAVRGGGDAWTETDPGTMDLDRSMTFTWRPGAGHHRYLVRRAKSLTDAQAADRAVERTIESLMLALPTATR